MNQPSMMMGGGSGSLGGAGPVNMPYGGHSGPGHKPPSKMMRMDDTGLLLIILILIVINSKVFESQKCATFLTSFDNIVKFHVNCITQYRKSFRTYGALRERSVVKVLDAHQYFRCLI